MENMDIQLKRFYNDIAHQFADEWYSNDSLLQVLKFFLSLLKPSPRVLDLGCGAGYESMRLKKLGADIVGIDYSIEPIRIARERNPDCRFEVMDFRKLDSSIGRFDGVVGIASLIHIIDDELLLVFRNIKNVMKPGGFIMFIVVEGQGLSKERSQIEMNGSIYNRPFYLHTKDRLTEVAENIGFKYYNDIELDTQLAKFGWKCFIYQA